LEFNILEILELKRVKDLLILKFSYKDIPLNPSQFFMIGPEVFDDKSFILNRPFSISNYDGEILEFRIRISGKFTNYLSLLNGGDKLRLIGPLGRVPEPAFYKGFDQIYLLGGGIGVAPLLYFYNYLNSDGIKVKLYFGAKDKDSLHYADGFDLDKIEVWTDDGSYGVKGFVTDSLKKLSAKNSLVVACGPLGMYKVLKNYTADFKIKVLMEERMACGFGVCLGCVVDSKSGYQRVCKEGPMFDLEQLILQ